MNTYGYTVLKYQHGVSSSFFFTYPGSYCMGMKNLFRNHHFIKLLLAGWLAIGFCLLTDLDENLCIVTVYYAIISVQSSVEATRLYVKNLLKWCALGLFVGLVTVEILAMSVTSEDMLTYLTLAALVFYGALVAPISGEARIGLSVTLFTAILGGSGGDPLMTTWTRGMSLLVAMSLGLVVSTFVFPTQTQTIVLNQMRGIHHEIEALFIHLGNFILNLDAKAPKRIRIKEKHLLHTIFNLRQEMMTCHESIKYLKKQGLHAKNTLFLNTLFNLGRNLNYLVSITRLANRMTHNPLLKEHETDITALFIGIKTSLDIWLHAICDEPVQVTVQDMEHIRQKIEKRLSKTEEHNMKDLTAFISLYQLLSMMHDDLRDMITEAHHIHPPMPHIEFLA